MSPQTFYRAALWTPIVVPAIFAAIVHGLGVPLGTGALQKLGQVLLGSLLYGSVPYAPLALWATWWMGGKEEARIRRLVIKAPLLMAAFFAVVSLIAGFSVGAPGPFAALAVLGAVVAIPLGYGYVAAVMLMREELSRFISESPAQLG